MAKRKVNKSQAIRDYVTANPDSSAKGVVAALAKRKIEVTPAMVATVKSKAGLTRGRRKSAKRAAAKSNGHTKASSAEFGIELLIEAKRFCAKAGSVDAAMNALKAINRLEAVS